MKLENPVDGLLVEDDCEESGTREILLIKTRYLPRYKDASLSAVNTEVYKLTNSFHVPCFEGAD